ncbi:AI-2E family transporter [Patescibacteria group bacterium]
MKVRNYNVYFFLLVLLGVTALAYLVFKPFLSAIAIALILAVVFYGVYKKFLKMTRNRKSLSSFLTCLLILLIIVIPFTVIFGLLAREAGDVYKHISQDEQFYQHYVLESIENIKGLPVVQSLDINGRLVDQDVTSSLQNFSQGFLVFIQKAYQNVVGFVIWVFVMFFSLYYFLIEGNDIRRRVMYLSPLKDEHEAKLLGKFVSMAKATLKGTVIIGIIQGILGGIMFAIAGIPSFIIWGVVMAVFSIIPAAGSGIVWAPAGIIMLALGNTWEGVFILAFGGIVISLLDNILRPKLVGSDTEMHPLLVFFATLGGLMAFGFIGFIIGPIIIALFLALWDIYGIEFRKQLGEYNK